MQRELEMLKNTCDTFLILVLSYTFLNESENVIKNVIKITIT